MSPNPPTRAADYLRGAMASLAVEVTDAQFLRNPDLERRYGAAGREHCHADMLYHLRFLTQAVKLSSPTLFTDYVGWAKIMLATRGVPATDLIATLELLGEMATRGLDEDAAAAVRLPLDVAIAALPSLPEKFDLLLDSSATRSTLTARYLQALLDGDRRSALTIVSDAIDGGMSLPDVYVEVFERSQKEIGRLWQMNRISVGQEHYCTAATQQIMAQLFPSLLSPTPAKHKLIAACVGDELHEVGLRIVTDLLELSGWNTRYLGANVPINSIVDGVADWNADVIALSTTLTPHVAQTERIIAAIRKDERTARTKVLVGGAPFQLEPELWEKIGADGWATDAREALRVAESLVSDATR